MYQFDATISSEVPADARHDGRDGRDGRDGTAPQMRAAPAQGPLSDELLDQMQRYWQAANYLTVGQIYLQANPLLREPVRPQQIKPRLLGHWRTSPRLSLIYSHII